MNEASYVTSEQASPGKKKPSILEEAARVKREAEVGATVHEWYTKAKAARQQKQTQWQLNMAFYYGKHWAEVRQGLGDFAGKLSTPNAPYYRKRKTINRIRMFARTEHSKFLSSIPNVVCVPGTAEDQDVRAAYAAEQAWKSISSAQKLRNVYSRAIWWTGLTGTGFVKTFWDKTALDKVSGENGCTRYTPISPFHIFVPDIREQDIEEQSYVIEAYIKPLTWVKSYFGDRLKGKTIKPSTYSQNDILDESFLNLSNSSNKPNDSCVVMECWVKPKKTEILPNGGLIIMVDDVVISLIENFPYAHGQYPYTKFEHIPTNTFYADSPIVDLIGLNKEYNESRTDISETARRMGRAQLLAVKGAITPSKMTNEIGQIIEYKNGYPAPTPLPLAQLPQYVIDQQDRILGDFEDIGGQHDVTRGQAPTGVTAGTAINYLGEKDNQYLTPEYQSIEDGYGKIAEQTLELFVQYVDMKRKIKVIGADMAFDTVALAGSDIKGGTDVRVEPGSSVGQSKAATDARVMDMFAMGLIDQSTALRLVEVGGAQKVLDILFVAERKAQRENTKMKALTVEVIQQHQEAFMMEQMQQLEQDPLFQPSEPPPVIPVDDFDVHEVHIESHNKFRMSQEYEMLPPEVKAVFSGHVSMHEDMLMEKQLTGLLDMLPEEGGDPNAAPEDAGPESVAPDSLAPNGQAPATPGISEGR